MFSKKQSPVATKIFCILLISTALLAALHLLLQYLNLIVYTEFHGAIFELSNRFDLDDESSVPTWFSQFLLLAVAAVSFFAAYLEKTLIKKRLWQVASIGALAFSIDEIATLHEYVLQLVHVTFFKDAAATASDNSWLILLPFVAVAGLMALYLFIKHFPKRTVILLTTGSIIFVAGAAFIDLATSVSSSSLFLKQGILVAAEESLELIGTSIILYAIIQYIESTYGTRIKLAIKQLKR